jgi:hypothetical protein
MSGAVLMIATTGGLGIGRVSDILRILAFVWRRYSIVRRSPLTPERTPRSHTGGFLTPVSKPNEPNGHLNRQTLHMTRAPRDRAEKPSEYRLRFLQELQLRDTIAHAQTFALNLPKAAKSARDLHSHLLRFLATLEGCPGGRFSINRRSQLVPAGARRDECQAYLQFVQRLVRSGEIPPDDQEFAERELIPSLPE